MLAVRRELEGRRQRPGMTEAGCSSLSKAAFPQLCRSRGGVHAQVNLTSKSPSVSIPLLPWTDPPQGTMRRHPPPILP